MSGSEKVVTDWRSRTLEQGEAWGLEYIVLGLDAGHRCGYVRVPEDHPWFGLDHADAVDGRKMPRTDRGHLDFDRTAEWPDYVDRVEGRLDAHGGITYAGKRPGEDCAEGWWFGFDCAHLYDRKDPDLIGEKQSAFEAEYPFPDDPCSEIRTTEYVADECKQLAAQLQAARVAFFDNRTEYICKDGTVE